MTVQEIRDLIVGAAKSHNTSLTLYYIGNCSSGGYNPEYPVSMMNYDDRSWAISFDDFSPSGMKQHFAQYNLILGATQSLPSIQAKALAWAIFQRYEMLRKATEEEEPEGHRLRSITSDYETGRIACVSHPFDPS